jgi:hypothetical protein
MEVYEALGGARCACCGETTIEFLTIDHVNGDGAKHRRRLKESGGYGGLSLYRSIKRAGFPPDFQVLCYNCNVGRHRNGGVCPHRR